MNEMNGEPMGDVVRIPLDGTYGMGALAELSIYTRVSKDSNELKEETFTVPYTLIDQTKLLGFNAAHLIAGFKIIKLQKPSALRELGL